MARPKLGDGETVRFQIVIQDELLQNIRDWQDENHIASTAEAIRLLCIASIEGESSVPTEEEVLQLPEADGDDEMALIEGFKAGDDLVAKVAAATREAVTSTKDFKRTVSFEEMSYRVARAAIGALTAIGWNDGGKTLRDEMASETLGSVTLHLSSYLDEDVEPGLFEREANILAKTAYAMADAMLAAREAKP